MLKNATKDRDPVKKTTKNERSRLRGVSRAYEVTHTVRGIAKEKEFM